MAWCVRKCLASQVVVSTDVDASVPWLCQNGSGACHAATTSKHRIARDQGWECTRCRLPTMIGFTANRAIHHFRPPYCRVASETQSSFRVLVYLVR